MQDKDNLKMCTLYVNTLDQNRTESWTSLFLIGTFKPWNFSTIVNLCVNLRSHLEFLGTGQDWTKEKRILEHYRTDHSVLNTLKFWISRPIKDNITLKGGIYSLNVNNNTVVYISME